jgi:hypothetical protein
MMRLENIVEGGGPTGVVGLAMTYTLVGAQL